ncbi:hypothetical protein [Streptomyces sp. NPDC059378]|uniref:hypothetical protein n=1 Tax=Streptomyces sp. NPDC059378 TaxID=3346815 RepID=UPI0036909AA7
MSETWRTIVWSAKEHPFFVKDMFFVKEEGRPGGPLEEVEVPCAGQAQVLLDCFRNRGMTTKASP